MFNRLCLGEIGVWNIDIEVGIIFFEGVGEMSSFYFLERVRVG